MPLGGSLCFAVVVAPLLDWLERREAQGQSVALARPALLVAIFLGIPAIGLAIEFGGAQLQEMMEEEDEQEAMIRQMEEQWSCDLRVVVPLMEEMEEIEDGALIAADTDRGSELVYRSDYGVLSIANHRYQPGFTLWVRAMIEYDLEESHRMLSERGVDALILCPPQIWNVLRDEGKTTIEQLGFGKASGPFEVWKRPEEADGFWIFGI